ncbi:MAG: hemolysin family protein [Acidimicrobiia bacterium]
MSVLAVVVAVFLILINGFFVSVEFAFTASRRTILEEREASGSKLARWALASMNELPVTFAGAQLGIVGASLVLGFVIENSLEVAFHGLYDTLGFPSGVVTTLSLVTALLIVTFAHNVFGEMAPKNATIAAPERIALIVSAPFRGYVTILRPLILALSWTAGGVLRLFGVQPRHAVEIAQSAEDIATLVKTIGAGGIIDPGSSRLLTSALKFQDTVVSEVMVPRPDLIAVSTKESAAAVEHIVVETGHSRIPVYGEDLDDIKGFVHAKDLLTVDPDWHRQPIEERLIRTVPVVPESMPVSPLLEMMRSEGVHIAVAIDEHGSVAGLVTLEDIAEELVGDIRDEHDIREVMEIRAAGRNRFLVAGQTRLDRLAEVGAVLEAGDYETVGGYLMAKLGRVPRRGDSLTTESFDIRVRRMDGRRVREVELTVKPPTPETIEEK